MENSGKLLGAQPASDGAVWPMILEKAYAKMFVSYSRLTGGLPMEALRTLTGQPVMAHLLLYFRDKYTSKKTYDLIKEAK